MMVQLLLCGIGLVSHFQYPAAHWQPVCGFAQHCSSHDGAVHLGVDAEVSGPVLAPCSGRVMEVTQQRIILECQLQDLCVSAVIEGVVSSVHPGARALQGTRIGWAEGVLHLGVRRGHYDKHVYSGCRDRNWNELEAYAAAATVCTRRILADVIDPDTLITKGN